MLPFRQFPPSLNIQIMSATIMLAYNTVTFMLSIFNKSSNFP